MFSIYTSNSPLLASINLNVYRKLETHGLTADTGKVVYDQVMILCANLDTSSHDNYLDWVAVWKQVNAILSQYNHVLKRPKSSHLNSMYYNIERATKRNIERALNIKDANEAVERSDEVEAKFQSYREQYLAYAETALTTMYNTRANGKLATSCIVMNRRSTEVIKKNPGLFARIFGAAA